MIKDKVYYLLYIDSNNSLVGKKIYEKDLSPKVVETVTSDANSGIIINTTPGAGNTDVDQILQWNIEGDCWEFINSSLTLEHVKVATPDKNDNLHNDYAATKKYVEQRLDDLNASTSNPNSATSNFRTELGKIFRKADESQGAINTDFEITTYLSNEIKSIEFGLISQTNDNSKYFVLYTGGTIVTLHQIS